MLLVLLFLPGAMASEQMPFPDISFKLLSTFAEQNFSSKISISTVLLILITLTNNTDLLSLHARQHNPKYPGENKVTMTAWMQSLSRAIEERLGENYKYLFKKAEQKGSSEEKRAMLSIKLDNMAKLLNLYPIDSKGRFQGKLLPISHDEISPVVIICPLSSICETDTCMPHALYLSTFDRDTPRVTLIQGTRILQNIQVLTGICKQCKTQYSADREQIPVLNQSHTRIYLNSAKFIKIGQSLWADRVFTNSVISGIYSFHASASAYTDFWNFSFGDMSTDNSFVLSRRHTWQAFIQESVRGLATAKGLHLEALDGLSIDELTKQAFALLGDSGIIRSADQHHCSECTQEYKKRSDTIGQNDNNQPHNLQGTQSNEEENEPAFVNMVVLDGIVMGPTVSFISHYIL